VTTWGNADLLVEMLDRQLRFFVEQERERRIILLARWLDFVTREPQLAGLAAELNLETKDALAEITKADHAIRDELASVWERVEPCIRESVGEAVHDDLFNVHCPISEYVARLMVRSSIKLSDATACGAIATDTRELVSALLEWTEWAIHASKTERKSAPVEVLHANKTVKDLDLRFKYLERQYLALCESHAGPALHRLRRLVLASNSAPPRHGEAVTEQQRTDQLFESVTFQVTSEFAALVHGAESGLLVAKKSDLDEALVQSEVDVRLVTHELQMRVLAGRSRLALVRRYAAQCEAFEAKSLRDLVKDDTKNAERTLTRDFAKYLFQQGMNPVLDPTIGCLRPDVVDAVPGDLLYVEAKQYGDSVNRRKVIDAFRQVWSTWGRLENAYRTPEAFLLIFRVGGPRIEPPKRLRCGGRTLYAVVVDISEQAGSKEKKDLLTLSESELLPPVSNEDSVAAT
jgi:hypothetical protein